MEQEIAIMAYNEEQVSCVVQEIVGDDDFINFADLAMVGPDPPFPENEEDCDE